MPSLIESRSPINVGWFYYSNHGGNLLLTWLCSLVHHLQYGTCWNFLCVFDNSPWILFALKYKCSRYKSVSRSVMSHSLWPHGLWPTRLHCPWNSPGKNTGVISIPFSRGSSWPRNQTGYPAWQAVSLLYEPAGKTLQIQNLLARWEMR